MEYLLVFYIVSVAVSLVARTPHIPKTWDGDGMAMEMALLLTPVVNTIVGIHYFYTNFKRLFLK